MCTKTDKNENALTTTTPATTPTTTIATTTKAIDILNFIKITPNRSTGKQQHHLLHTNNINRNNNNNAHKSCLQMRQFCDAKNAAINIYRNTVILCTTISLLIILDNLVGGAAAAPQSCILCDKDDLKVKQSSSNYEEFLFEHQVTRQDAINALKGFNESFYVGPSSESSCKSLTCTKKIMNYCLGPQFINDHCWCEFGHTDEGLPFVPHICYVGEKLYTASVGSCFFYEEVKDCCCSAALAKQWRHISGAQSYTNPCRSWFLLILAQLLILYIAAHNFSKT